MRGIIRWTWLTAVVVVLAAALPVLAQDENGPAAIVTFDSSLTSTTITEVEAGETTATLSWHVVGLDEDQRLVLDRYELNGFVSLLEDGDTTLPPSATRDVTVTSPSSFAPPTYRLAILDFRNRIVDQRIATIPYTTPADDEVAITEFTADASTLTPSALEAGNARVMVTWEITNRPPSANPVFEQLLPGGEAVNVELPRSFVWVPSVGSGAVAPVAPEVGSAIDLRLRVVDLVNDTVYAEEILTLPAAGTSQAPDTGETPEATANAAAETAPAPDGMEIVSFTATPETVALGDVVQLNWDVQGAASVQIRVRTGTSIEQQPVAENLPLRAGLTIPVSEAMFSGVNRVTFVIRPVDAAGNALGLGRADVSIGPSAPAATEAAQG